MLIYTYMLSFIIFNDFLIRISHSKISMRSSLSGIRTHRSAFKVCRSTTTLPGQLFTMGVKMVIF